MKNSNLLGSFANKSPLQGELEKLIYDESPTKTDFTNANLKSLSFEGGDFFQCLFKGALLERCSFAKTQFSRSDFAATDIVRCEFDRCDFSPMGIRSSRFVECTFRNCDLSSVGLMESEFVNCEFFECSFEASRKRDNDYRACLFESCNWIRCSTVLNHYQDCSFRDITLGNCTLMYCIYDECNFSNVKINLEGVGHVYGLTTEQIKEMNFVYLGEEINGDLSIFRLKEIHREHEWHIGTAILDFMDGERNFIDAMKRYFADLMDSFDKRTSVEVDEVEFVYRMFEHLFTRSRLPGSSLKGAIECFSGIRNRIEDHSDTRSKRIAASLSEIVNKLNLLWLKFLDLSNDTIYDRVSVSAADARLTIVFHEEPTFEVEGSFKEIARICGQNSPRKLSARPGSYIEEYSMDTDVVAGVVLFFNLLNGNVDQHRDLLERLRQILNLGNRPVAVESTGNIYRPDGPTRGRPFSEEGHRIQIRIAEYVERLSCIDDPELGGLNQENVLKITLDAPQYSTLH